ncbi:hypothetical protein DAMA08_016650 [Martiniozyma asiatica (nom. inval.)]|nr:hypothetical protein DAMA08_016650 [Martiniozyma asiatica]
MGYEQQQQQQYQQPQQYQQQPQQYQQQPQQYQQPMQYQEQPQQKSSKSSKFGNIGKRLFDSFIFGIGASLGNRLVGAICS